MKIRIITPGGEQGEAIHQCDGEQIVIGRSPDCDVTIPIRHVSSRHAMIVQGLAVIDLKSTNGIFVEGARIEDAAAVLGGKFMLGSEVEVVIEADALPVEEEAPPVDFDATLLSGSESALDVTPMPLRSEEPDPPRATPETPIPIPSVKPAEASESDADLVAALERQRAESEDLRRRVESLKQDIEERENADADSPQARLAHDAMQSVRDQNEALQARVLELEKEKGRADVEAAKRVLEGRVAELESSKADLFAEVEKLQGQLEDAQEGKAAAEASPASNIFFKLQGEIVRLKKELADTRNGATEETESGALFFDLREENERLKRRLEEATADASVEAPTEPGDPSQVAELERELHAERMSKADMLDELAQLRSKAESTGAISMPTVRPGAASEALALLGRAAREDVTGLPTDVRLPTEEFLALELFRFVRHGEKVVTRLAGQFIQLYNPTTMLPGSERTLRELTEELVQTGDDANLRVEFTDYLEKLTEWLGAAIHAYPQAAEAYAFQLREQLSEASLTKDDPIPTLKRLSGQSEGELWERASKVLNRLSDETVRDGVERPAREMAEDFLGDSATS